MGLMCVDRGIINFIMTVYFLSYALAGLILFTLPDKWGCRKTILIFGTLHIIAQFIILFVPNYTIRLTMYAVMGLA